LYCIYLFVYAGYCIWQHEADVDLRPVNTHNEQRPDHNTGNSAPYSLKIDTEISLVYASLKIKNGKGKERQATPC